MPRISNLPLPQPLENYTTDVFNELATAAAVLFAQADNLTENTANLQKLVNEQIRRLLALDRLIKRRISRNANDQADLLPDERLMNHFDVIVGIFLTAAAKFEALARSNELEFYGALLAEVIADETSD